MAFRASAAAQSLTVARMVEGHLPYVSPPFEINALRVAGWKHLPNDWRRETSPCASAGIPGERPERSTRSTDGTSVPWQRPDSDPPGFSGSWRRHNRWVPWSTAMFWMTSADATLAGSSQRVDDRKSGLPLPLTHSLLTVLDAVLAGSDPPPRLRLRSAENSHERRKRASRRPSASSDGSPVSRVENSLGTDGPRTRSSSRGPRADAAGGPADGCPP